MMPHARTTAYKDAIRSRVIRQAIHPNLRGFTLLEVLVALLVIGFVFTVLTQISGTSARASRTLPERMQTLWQNEQLALGYVRALQSGLQPDVPDGLTVDFQPSSGISPEEALRLANRAPSLTLSRLAIRAEATGEVIWLGDLLLPQSGGE